MAKKADPDNPRQPDAGTPGGFIVDPKSTLTPAYCGAATWLIAKTLGGIFGFDDGVVGVFALVISGLFAAAVVAQITVRRMWQRGLYWVLNSLIILTMGIGGNTLVALGDKEADARKRVLEEPAPTPRPPTATPAPTPGPAPPPTATPAPPAPPAGEKPTVLNHAKRVVRDVGKVLIKRPF